MPRWKNATFCYVWGVGSVLMSLLVKEAAGQNPPHNVTGNVTSDVIGKAVTSEPDKQTAPPKLLARNATATATATASSVTPSSSVPNTSTSSGDPLSAERTAKEALTHTTEQAAMHNTATARTAERAADESTGTTTEKIEERVTVAYRRGETVVTGAQGDAVTARPGGGESTSAGQSAGDCQVRHLSVVSVNTTNVTLTWQSLTSMSEVKGVFYVVIQGQNGVDNCVQYTVIGASKSETSGTRGVWSDPQRSCQPMSETLRPQQGRVTIRGLKICTHYHVTVTSDCSACSCEDSGTAALASFTTLSTVPGQVDALRVELDGQKGRAGARVSWWPAVYPACGVSQYRLLLLKEDDGACVLQVLFRSAGGHGSQAGAFPENGDESLCIDSVTKYGSLTSPQFAFNNLLPDTNYTLNVSAINDVGEGPFTSHPIHTPIAVPTAPTDLRVQWKTSESVTLGWRPPVPRPGPTWYTVHVLDLGSPYRPLATPRENSSHPCATGYKKSSCNVDHLRTFWRYRFALTAHSTSGQSPAALTEVITTDPSAPGAAETLEVKERVDNFTTVNVTWNCPALTNRNTRITGFLVRALLQVGEDHTNHTLDVKYLSTEDCDVDHSVDFPVIPDNDYVFEVLTLGERYNATVWATVAFHAPDGLSEAVSNLTVVTVGAEAVTVQWSAPRVTNGQLKAYKVLVLEFGVICKRSISVPLERGADNYPAFLRPPTIWGSCNTRNHGDNLTVALGEQSVTLTINDLPPDTDLTLEVFPGNGAGWGLPAKVSVRTLEEAPMAPTSISVEILNATALAVSWEEPRVRTGPTNYTVVLYRATVLGGTAPSFLEATTVGLIGWHHHEAVVTGLWSGWRYSLTLTASTNVGSRCVVRSAPGPVQSVSVLPVANDYRRVKVTWDYPALRAWNGVIVNFTFCYQGEGFHRELCRTVSRPCRQTSPQFCVTLDVIPGHNYSVEVRANNEYNGLPLTTYYQAMIGPPPALREVSVTQPASWDNSQSTFRVTFCAPCLLNDTNGEITFIALLVCRYPHCQQVNKTVLGSRSMIESLPSWTKAMGNNFQTLYRPTADEWICNVRTLLARDGGREADGGGGQVYTVGEEEQCGSDVYCNGPLPAGEDFRVMAVACTSVSCSASAFSSPVHTADAPPSNVVALTVIGIVLCLALILLVVILVIYYRQRRQDKAKRDHLRPVTIQDYEDRLREWKSVLQTGSHLPAFLVQQFDELRACSPQHSHEASVMQDNKQKNRYTNILPFDHSRVKLEQLDDDVTTDYINANYIPGYHSKREYIATQGPLRQTVDDFWRMVWEQRCPVIVMLSALTEGRLNKVYKYFPDEDQLHEPVTYGVVTVTLQDVDSHEDYLVRTFQLTVGGSEHEVKQFFVDSWQDFKANLTPGLVLDFVQAVRAEVPPANHKHPLLVHCSAGVGRSGTWMAIDYFMHYVHHSPLSAPLSVRDFVLAMRDCRANMVQSVEQYVFIHEVVAELVRRKTDRYEEPVGNRHMDFVNGAFELSGDVAANSSVSQSSSSNNQQAAPPSTTGAPPSPPLPSASSDFGVDVITSRL